MTNNFKKIAMVLYITAMILGVVVLFVWMMQISLSFRILTNLVPMQFNVALCLTLISFSCILLLINKNLISISFATFVFLLSSLTLIQYIIKFDFGIDQILMQNDIILETSHPGRMAPNTAICFILTSLFVCLYILGSKFDYLYFLAKIINFTQLLLAAMALVGYFFQLKLDYGWDNLTHMSALTAFSFLFIGIGNQITLRYKEIKHNITQPKIAYSIYSLGCTIFFLIWIFEINNERDGIINSVNDTAILMAQQADKQLTFQVQALKRIAFRWEKQNGTNEDAWRDDTSNYIKHYQVFRSISYIDKNYNPKWIEPKKIQFKVEDILEYLINAKNNNSVFYSKIYYTQYKEAVFYVIIPTNNLKKQHDGFIVAEYNIYNYIETLMNKDFINKFNIQFTDGANILYSNIEKNNLSDNKLSLVNYSYLDKGNLKVNLNIEPGVRLLEVYITGLPALILSIGFIISIMVSLICKFFYTVRDLKVNNEIILNNAGNGIYGIDSYGRITFVNTFAVNMLKYNLNELIGFAQHKLIQYHRLDGSLYPANESEIYKSLRVGNSITIDSEVFCRKDGTLFPVEYTVTPIKDTKKEVTGAVVVFNDITQRKEYENRIINATKEANQANKIKSLFLSNMSHEIRTPLNAIIGNTEISLDVLEQQPDSVEWIAQVNKQQQCILRNSEHLLNLINDILDFSKIEDNKLDIEKINFSTEEYMTSIKDVFQNEAANKNIHFSIDIDDNLPKFLNGDITRLKQVTINLISNAVKFTNQQGFVKFSINYTFETSILEITVSDTGIGIAGNKINKIFDAFKQADESIARKYSGTGLGLAISRNLCRLMGGDLNCSSSIGIGSNFVAKFKFEIGEEITKIANQSDKYTLQSNELNVLIAEDWKDNQEIIKWYMEKMKINYTLVESGIEVIEKVTDSNNYYHLILMDIQMPDMDGSQATKILRFRGYEHPIVALTANAIDEQIAEYLQVGFDYVVPKPFKAEHIKKVIANTINNTISRTNKKDEAYFYKLEENRADFISSISKEIDNLQIDVREEDYDNLLLKINHLKILLLQFKFNSEGREAIEIEKLIRLGIYDQAVNNLHNFYNKLRAIYEDN